MHLAEFMPPIIHRRLSKLWSTQSPQYSSFAEAERACGPGYQEHELISLVVEKTRRARQRLQSNTVAEVDLAALRMLPGLDAFGGDQPFNVVDFGGGCGYHGLIINKALGQQSRVKWYVIETPAMVQAAKEMEDENLRFFSSIEEAAKAIDKIHVLYSSGTLQYLPNPCATLAHLLAIANPQTVRLTRLALTPLSNDQYFR